MSEALSVEARKAILEREIAKYVRAGWQVQARTDTTAQLVRDKKASCGLTLLLALFLIVPAILYWLLYRGSESLYLEVDARGRVRATRG